MAVDAPRVNILLVDDEPKNLVALESVLASDDLNLVHATSGQEALKYLLLEDFAAVLLDVHMPGLDGFETAELIRGRDRSRDTPIIFLTAAIRGDSFVAKGYSLGAVDYIVKPFDPDILRSKVAVFVELFRKTQQVKRQANELAEATAFLNSILESSTEHAIIAMDLAGVLLAWNEGAQRLYGYTANEVVGKQNVTLLHHPDDVAAGRVAALLRAAARSGKADAELEHVRKNGRRFPASITVNRRLDASGRRIGYVAIARDVTAIKRAERERAQLIEEQVARAAAEAARDRLKQVVDVLPEAVLIAGPDGRIVLSNAAAQEIMGADPPAIGEAYASMLCLDESPCPPAALPLARSVAAGEVVRGEQLLVANALSGRKIPVLVNSAPLRTVDGALAGGVMVFQDISAIKDLEREKDDFLAAASHDLKNPLAAIKARAQILLRRAERPDGKEAASIAEGLRSIDQSATRLTGMINELLDVARLQMGRPIELDRQPLDLAALVRQVAADLQPSTDRHVIRVESRAASIIGEWDRARLERVVANLISNAIKYSPEGGEVILALQVEHVGGTDWAVLRVRDQGLGIPAEELPQVFERFYRGSNVAGRIEGTGIGLSGVRQIVAQHGGQVMIESQESAGTTLIVRLPLSATAARS